MFYSLIFPNDTLDGDNFGTISGSLIIDPSIVNLFLFTVFDYGDNIDLVILGLFLLKVLRKCAYSLFEDFYGLWRYLE